VLVVVGQDITQTLSVDYVCSVQLIATFVQKQDAVSPLILLILKQEYVPLVRIDII
jgi:hypothetical protein